MPASYKMLKVGLDSERVFAGEHARREVRLLPKRLRCALLSEIKFTHMSMARRYTRMNIKWHSPRLFIGYDGLIVTPPTK
jgi:hypothetical protein